MDEEDGVMEDNDRTYGGNCSNGNGTGNEEDILDVDNYNTGSEEELREKRMDERRKLRDRLRYWGSRRIWRRAQTDWAEIKQDGFITNREERRKRIDDNKIT